MMVADASYGCRNGVALVCRKLDWWLNQTQARGMLSAFMGIEQGRAVGVVLAIGRSTLVAVQPGAVGAERDEVRYGIGHFEVSPGIIGRMARVTCKSSC